MGQSKSVEMQVNRATTEYSTDDEIGIGLDPHLGGTGKRKTEKRNKLAPLHQARSPSRDQAHTRRQLSLFLTRVLLEEDRVLGSGDVEALADKSREARNASFGQVLKAVRDDGANLPKGCTVCQPLLGVDRLLP